MSLSLTHADFQQCLDQRIARAKQSAEKCAAFRRKQRGQLYAIERRYNVARSIRNVLEALK